MSALAEEVCAFVEEHLEVELLDWQRAYIEALYDEGAPGALART